MAHSLHLRTPPASLRYGMGDGNMPRLKSEKCPVLLERLKPKLGTPRTKALSGGMFGMPPLGRGFSGNSRPSPTAAGEEVPGGPISRGSKQHLRLGGLAHAVTRSLLAKPNVVEWCCWNTDL